MNPNQVHCPGCQKLYLVKSEDLHVGVCRFECTDCKSLFGVQWPQPPEVSVLPSFILHSEKFVQAASPPTASATVETVEAKLAAICPRCGFKNENSSPECLKCGVVFEKFKTLKSNTSLAPASEEMRAAWEKVKSNFADEKTHENFIQTCLKQNNLSYASYQYRSILLANPNEELARRMQNKIIEAASETYLKIQNSGAKTKKRFQLPGYVMLFAGAMIAVGISVPQASTLIAIGASLIVFVLSINYFGKIS